ncbi:hypothetical protein VTO73DRAFT_2756 [Trametes versicolor]
MHDNALWHRLMLGDAELIGVGMVQPKSRQRVAEGTGEPAAMTGQPPCLLQQEDQNSLHTWHRYGARKKTPHPDAAARLAVRTFASAARQFNEGALPDVKMPAASGQMTQADPRGGRNKTKIGPDSTRT